VFYLISDLTLVFVLFFLHTDVDRLFCRLIMKHRADTTRFGTICSYTGDFRAEGRRCCTKLWLFIFARRRWRRVFERPDVPTTLISALTAWSRINVALTSSHIRLAINGCLEIVEEGLVCALERVCPCSFLFALIHH